jgi:hypothetical protein
MVTKAMKLKNFISLNEEDVRLAELVEELKNKYRRLKRGGC